MKSFAQTKGSMSDWLYIFEDDIALHNLSIAPICDIKAAETVAMGDGILYLGACPKTCYKFSAVTFLGRVFEKCWGHCAHAIGITKWKSFSLPEFQKQKISYVPVLRDTVAHFICPCQKNCRYYFIPPRREGGAETRATER